MQPNDITFFQRFQDDILAGRKTITIRDESESHFKTGDVLRVGRFEDDGYFCTIEVTATSTVTLDTLTEKHAEQENMTLTELKKVIADIYPGQTQLIVLPKGQRFAKFQRTGQRAKMSGAEMGKRTTRFLMEHQRLQPRRTQPRQKFLVPGNVALR